MPGRRYPRAARVNEVLRQVLAEAIERLADTDERLAMLTVTAVEVDPDLRHARVLFDSIPEPAAEALRRDRVRLQAAIALEVRLKRTPQLSFEPDPAVASGRRVEDILRRLGTGEGPGDPGGAAAASPPVPEEHRPDGGSDGRPAESGGNGD